MSGLTELQEHYGVREWSRQIASHRAAPIAARLLSRVVEDGDCWNWTGATQPRYGVIGRGGYGTTARSTRQVYVHRLAYELWVGPIPDSQQIDHLCRNRLCIRPDHLEAVPQQVNLDRGFGPWAINKRKTHCKRGHEFTPENTYPQGRDRTARGCRTCRRDLKRSRALAGAA